MTTTKMKRTYENALKILDTRRRKVRPAAAPTGDRRTIKDAPTFRGKSSLSGMSEWLRVLGYSESNVNNLNIIHVSGTKGKGSTCAFVRSLLLAHGVRTGFPQKVGLYTSPDLRGIRERIQINDRPIGERLFTKYFFEVWDRLSGQPLRAAHGSEELPRYLQLLALVSIHVFIRENVDAAIYETHHGGEYDSTNVIANPSAVGIASIGMDHVAQLGPSLANIAWHKAGILKTGTPAFSVPQEPEAAGVIEARAVEKQVKLEFVDINPLIPAELHNVKLLIQRQNCSLAIGLADALLEQRATGSHSKLTPNDIIRGIERFSWPGRFETIVDGDYQWFLDGAHNELSLAQAVHWFAGFIPEANHKDSSPPIILIFSHYSEERDGPELLQCLAKSLLESGIRPQHVIFTTYKERLDESTRIDKTFKVPEKPFPDYRAIYAEMWAAIDQTADILKESTIEGALNRAREIGDMNGGMQTLVTGSLYLVGGALSLLRPNDDEGTNGHTHHSEKN